MRARIWSRRWTPEDDARLESYYPTHGAGFAALLLKRTTASVTHRACNLGVQYVGRPWTEADDAALLHAYDLFGYYCCVYAVPGHDHFTCKRRRSQLKLAPPPRPQHVPQMDEFDRPSIQSHRAVGEWEQGTDGRHPATFCSGLLPA